MVHMYSWKVIIVSLFARIWFSICYTQRTLSKFLESFHCLCNFLDIGGVFVFLVVFYFSCSGPSCSDTWKVTVLKRGKESLSILAAIILLSLNIEQTVIHSLISSNGNKHFGWRWFQMRNWGCLLTVLTLSLPQFCNYLLLLHINRVFLFIWLAFACFFFFSTLVWLHQPILPKCSELLWEQLYPHHWYPTIPPGWHDTLSLLSN